MHLRGCYQFNNNDKKIKNKEKREEVGREDGKEGSLVRIRNGNY